MNYLYLITLIWFSKTLCAKHYLVETKDSYTDTTPSSNLQQDSKQNSKFFSKLYQTKFKQLHQIRTIKLVQGEVG